MGTAQEVSKDSAECTYCCLMAENCTIFTFQYFLNATKLDKSAHSPRYSSHNETHQVLYKSLLANRIHNVLQRVQKDYKNIGQDYSKGTFRKQRNQVEERAIFAVQEKIN